MYYQTHMNPMKVQTREEAETSSSRDNQSDIMR